MYIILTRVYYLLLIQLFTNIYLFAAGFNVRHSNKMLADIKQLFKLSFKNKLKFLTIFNFEFD